MPDQLVLTIQIESEDGQERKAEFVCDLPVGSTAEQSLQWFSYYFSTEAQVEARWSEYLGKLPDPGALCSGRSATITTSLGPEIGAYYDAANSAWIWFEICNLLSSSRIYLARARAYKDFEPAHSGTPGKENEVVYRMHLRRMDEFHLAVKDIKKLEDMILRLIFEGLGGTLEGIDTSKDEWERQLTLDKVKDGLKERESNQALKNMSDSEYNELRNIRSAMSHGGNQNLAKFWQYRHALEHRMPQSVDFLELYTTLESRPEPIIKDGKVVALRGFIGSRPINPDWRFDDLYNTTVSVYKYYLELLERLNKLSKIKQPS